MTKKILINGGFGSLGKTLTYRFLNNDNEIYLFQEMI